MLFYAAGSILFTFAFIAAWAVIATSFRNHGAQMRAALHNLSFDSAYAPVPAPAKMAAAPVRTINDRSREWLAAA